MANHVNFISVACHQIYGTIYCDDKICGTRCLWRFEEFTLRAKIDVTVGPLEV